MLQAYDAPFRGSLHVRLTGCSFLTICAASSGSVGICKVLRHAGLQRDARSTLYNMPNNMICSPAGPQQLKA